MERKHLRWLPLVIAAISFAVYYFSSDVIVNPVTGTKSRVGLSHKEEMTLGLQGYQQVLAESETITSGPQFEMVDRVAKKIIQAASSDGKDFEWKVSLVVSNEVNAFCLPGGKIVIYTGILPIAKNDAGLAAVMGHEVAHATSRHGAQRVFQEGALDIAVTGIQGSIADMDPEKQRLIMGAIGVGSKFGILLPYSRSHELEADEVGLHYMAKAGYDPEEAVRFWERMRDAGGSKPPEFASTHPNDQKRIDNLKKIIKNKQLKNK